MDPQLLLSLAERKAIVLEIGMRFTKVGFSGDAEPRHILKTQFVLRDGAVLDPVFNVQKYNTAHWSEALFLFFHNIFFRYLLVNPHERPVVIVESLLTPNHFRQRVAATLFEQFDVPAIVFLSSQPLALIPLQRRTALIVDVGFSHTTIVPVYKGSIVLHALQSLPIGSHTLHSQLNTLFTTSLCFAPHSRSESFSMKSPWELTTDSASSLSGSVPRTFQPLSECLSRDVLDDILVRVCYVSPHLSAAALPPSAAKGTPPTPTSTLPSTSTATLWPRRPPDLHLRHVPSPSVVLPPPLSSESQPHSHSPPQSTTQQQQIGHIPSESSSQSKSTSNGAVDISNGILFPLTNGVLYVSHEVRSKVFDVLFELDNEQHSLPSLCLDCLLKCNSDLRLSLANKILLVGGTVMSIGFRSRFVRAVEHLITTRPRYALLSGLCGSFNFLDSLFASNILQWVGGSILASVNMSDEFTVQRSEFISKRTLPDWTRIPVNKTANKSQARESSSSQLSQHQVQTYLCSSRNKRVSSYPDDAFVT